MSFDLSDLLSDWPYEPGQLRVRKIVGTDGLEKLQLRLDMGVLQMEMKGRPDGREPHGAESELAYQQEQAKEKGDEFSLTDEDVGELHAEGVQYYHRYLALFQLGDWQGVVRDTKRNLEMFSFVAEHATGDDVIWSVLQFRPYVLMMNTRAKASLALEKGDVGAAILLVEKGIARIERFLTDSGRKEDDAENPEVVSLREWLVELKNIKPLTPVEKLQHEMDLAVQAEQFERAAELRDAIRNLQQNG